MSATLTPDVTETTAHTTVAPDTAPVPASNAASTGSVPFPNGPVAADHSRAFTITSFVLGIASVASGWTFFAPITGLIFGILALRRGTQDRALALWGVWLNAAMLAIWAVIALAGTAVFGFAALAHLAAV
ncbi:DUF4190 domain-containing protein [Leucobacter japonicus]|uniref:DUF4190 domain-containing protein n=1 Tax=Leucobacter japonicus TaxID=1461259 RepID=UPI0006A780E0|nr:DUF4190 domain-containing protein [Leucobacter japonicus]